MNMNMTADKNKNWREIIDEKQNQQKNEYFTWIFLSVDFIFYFVHAKI